MGDDYVTGALSSSEHRRDEPAQLDEPGGDRTGHVTEPAVW
jgi:hypothetical protein